MPAGTIDAHVHVYDETSGSKAPRAFTTANLFNECRPVGVGRVVLIQLSSYKFDNTYMLRALEQHPGMFSAVAIADSTRPDIADEMARLRHRGARGFRISPGRDPVGWLDTPGMQAMWKAAANLRMAMCPLVNPDALPSIDRMCAQHPATTVVIDHMARIGAGGRVEDAQLRLLSALARHANVYVKVSAFYALGAKQPPYLDLVPLIRRLVEDFGPRRLMWASDAPFQAQAPHTYAASLALVRDRLPFLDKDGRDWLLGATAEKVFFHA